MNIVRGRLTFLLLCLTVFGVSYTLLGQGPGDDAGDGELGPVGQVNELFEVIVGGDVEQLEQALRNGADPNTTDDDGQAALHWTVLGSRISPTVYGQVQTLLAHGANPNQPADNGMTAVHVAALYGSEALMDKLIASGGDPNIATAGHTPYELALITDNPGAVVAIERTSDYRLENRAMFEALGIFSRRMRKGVLGDTTTQEKETAVREAVRGLIQSGYITAEDGEKIYQEAMKELQSHGCEDCGNAKGGNAKGQSGENVRIVSPSYGTHGNEALRGPKRA